MKGYQPYTEPNKLPTIGARSDDRELALCLWIRLLQLLPTQNRLGRFLGAKVLSIFGQDASMQI